MDISICALCFQKRKRSGITHKQFLPFDANVDGEKLTTYLHAVFPNNYYPPEDDLVVCPKCVDMLKIVHKFNSLVIKTQTVMKQSPELGLEGLWHELTPQFHNELQDLRFYFNNVHVTLQEKHVLRKRLHVSENSLTEPEEISPKRKLSAVWDANRIPLNKEEESPKPVKVQRFPNRPYGVFRRVEVITKSPHPSINKYRFNADENINIKHEESASDPLLNFEKNPDLNNGIDLEILENDPLEETIVNKTEAPPIRYFTTKELEQIKNKHTFSVKNNSLKPKTTQSNANTTNVCFTKRHVLNNANTLTNDLSNKKRKTYSNPQFILPKVSNKNKTLLNISPDNKRHSNASKTNVNVYSRFLSEKSRKANLELNVNNSQTLDQTKANIINEMKHNFSNVNVTNDNNEYKNVNSLECTNNLIVDPKLFTNDYRFVPNVNVLRNGSTTNDVCLDQNNASILKQQLPYNVYVNGLNVTDNFTSVNFANAQICKNNDFYQNRTVNVANDHCYQKINTNVTEKLNDAFESNAILRNVDPLSQNVTDFRNSETNNNVDILNDPEAFFPTPTFNLFNENVTNDTNFNEPVLNSAFYNNQMQMILKPLPVQNMGCSNDFNVYNNPNLNDTNVTFVLPNATSTVKTIRQSNGNVFTEENLQEIINDIPEIDEYNDVPEYISFVDNLVLKKTDKSLILQSVKNVSNEHNYAKLDVF